MWYSKKVIEKKEVIPSSHNIDNDETGASTTMFCQIINEEELDNSNNNDTQTINWICQAPNCSRRGRRHIRPPPSENRTTHVSSNIKTNNIDNSTMAMTKIHGQVIFCVPDYDPNWVQGYLIPQHSTKPWGLLAVQTNDFEDCCGDKVSGGYRQLSLTVYHNKQKQNNSSNTNQKQPYKIDGVDWTGGDMMSLYHPCVDMIGERLLTGEKALPLLHKYFSNLLQRLKEEMCVGVSGSNNSDEDNNETKQKCSTGSVSKSNSVLEWLPNVAIVTGSMTLTVPK